MGQGIIKNPRRVVSYPGGSSDPRVDILAANEFKVLYWASISSTSGTISIPTGATILLNQLPAGKDANMDAYLSQITSSQPNGDFPITSSAAMVVVSSFDASGNYTLSGTPSAFPVALVYLLKISALNWSNLTTANIVEDSDYNLRANSLQVGSTAASGFIKIGNSTMLGSTTGALIYTRDAVSGHVQKPLVSELVDAVGEQHIELRGNGGSGTSRNMLRLSAYDWGYVGNYTGSSIPKAYSAQLEYSNSSAYAGDTGNATVLIRGTPIINAIGTTSTNYGTRLDATGLRVGQLSTLHTANTVSFEVPSIKVNDLTGNYIPYSINGVLTTSLGLYCGATSVGGNFYFNSQSSAGTLAWGGSSGEHFMQVSSSYMGFYLTPRFLGKMYIGATTVAATAWLHIAAGTTSQAQIRLVSSVAPTSPNDGDIWFDGTDVKIRVAGVTKTFTIT